MLVRLACSNVRRFVYHISFWAGVGGSRSRMLPRNEWLSTLHALLWNSAYPFAIYGDHVVTIKPLVF
jgi:hypothetical protein